MSREETPLHEALTGVAWGKTSDGNPLGDRPTEDGFEDQRMRASLQARLFQTGGSIRLGRFEVQRMLGEGGMGAVYRAYDPELDRLVALKLLRIPDDELGRRLVREARALARVAHPHIAAVLDVGISAGKPYLAMEYVDGGSLRTWCLDHPMGEPHRVARVLDFAEQAARGLMALHAAGIVHRDLKPHNMLIGGDGRLRLADFGLARDGSLAAVRIEHDGGADVTSERDASFGDDESFVTQGGQVVGTPAYMAPEQFEGRSDALSDQFSFCVTFWEALHGCRPLAGETPTEVWVAATRGDLVDPPRVGVPRRVQRILRRGLQPDPKRRHPDMRSLLEALEAARRPRARWIIPTLGVATILGMVAYGALDRADPCRAVAAAADSVWNDARRGDLRGRFAAVASDDSVAFDRFDDGVSTYLEHWRAARRSACSATWRDDAQSEADLDLRMRCLDRRLRAVDDLVLAHLERPLSIDALDRVADGLGNLAPIGECADLEGLRAELPAPAEPSRRATHDALERELSTLHARAATASLVELRDTAEDLVRRAERLDHDPIVARCRLFLGEVAAQTSDADATHSFELALAAAQRSGADRIAVRAALHWASIAVREGRPASEALLQIELAESLIPRINGNRVLYESVVLGARSEVLQAEGQVEEALALLERRLALLDSSSFSPDRDARSVAHELIDTLHGIGWSARTLGRTDQARAALRRALELMHEYETSVPQIAAVHAALGALETESGRAAAALEHHRATLELARARLGPDHQAVAQALANMGTAYRDLGLHVEAAEHHERALTIFERVLPSEHRFQVVQRVNVAALHSSDPEKAHALLLDAIELARAHHGPNSPELGQALSARGFLLRLGGDGEAAAAALRESLAIHDETKKAKLQIRDRAELALVLIDRGELEQADALARESLAMARDLYEGGAQQSFWPLLAHGRARLAAGAWEEAIRDLQEAVSIDSRRIEAVDREQAHRALDQARAEASRLGRNRGG